MYHSERMREQLEEDAPALEAEIDALANEIDGLDCLAIQLDDCGQRNLVDAIDVQITLRLKKLIRVQVELDGIRYDLPRMR